MEGSGILVSGAQHSEHRGRSEGNSRTACNRCTPPSLGLCRSHSRQCRRPLSDSGLTWTMKSSVSPVDPANQSVPTSAERMFSIGNFELSRVVLTFTTLGWIGPVQSNRKINAYQGENTILPILSFPAWSSPTSLHPLSTSHNLPGKGKRSRKRRRKCISKSSLSKSSFHSLEVGSQVARKTGNC